MFIHPGNWEWEGLFLAEAILFSVIMQCLASLLTLYKHCAVRIVFPLVQTLLRNFLPVCEGAPKNDKRPIRVRFYSMPDMVTVSAVFLGLKTPSNTILSSR